MHAARNGTLHMPKNAESVGALRHYAAMCERINVISALLRLCVPSWR